jgi:hypothetical protein
LNRSVLFLIAKFYFVLSFLEFICEKELVCHGKMKPDSRQNTVMDCCCEQLQRKKERKKEKIDEGKKVVCARISGLSFGSLNSFVCRSQYLCETENFGIPLYTSITFFLNLTIGGGGGEAADCLRVQKDAGQCSDVPLSL